MIRAKNLSISFSGRTIFSEGNFIINQREKVGLIGRNGSGKSTFLKLILKKLEPDDGAVEIIRLQTQIFCQCQRRQAHLADCAEQTVDVRHLEAGALQR